MAQQKIYGICENKCREEVVSRGEFDTTRDTLANDILTERSRIDTFTKMQEGSTTGDAELTDIRVGYNGKKYNTAGEAVRGQCTELSKELNAILKKEIDVSVRLPVYADNNTNIHATGTTVFTISKAILIPADAKIKYTGAIVNPYLMKFVFSNKETFNVGEKVNGIVLEGKTDEIVEGFIDIPSGYKYLFIGSNANVSGKIIPGDNYQFVPNINGLFNAIEKNTNDIELNKKDILKNSSEIAALKENIGTAKKKILYLPVQYNLVVGDTFELFWKGIMLSNDYKRYNIKVSCSVGSVYAKKYMFTPKSEHVGTKQMTIELYDDNENLVDSGTVNLVIKAKAQNPSVVKNVLCVGDSLLVNGAWAAESNRRIAKTGGKPAGDNLTNIKYIGTMQKDGAGYEGNGGWTFSSYNTEYKNPSFVWITTIHNKTGDDQHSVYRDANGTEWKIETLEVGKLKMIRVKGSGTMLARGTLTWVSGGTNHESIVFSASEVAAGNPFWNEKTGKVDFAEYAKKVKANSIDYCYILLGWNSSEWGKNRTISETKKFISNLLSSFPSCKVILLGLQIPSLDGFGENYGCAWNWYEKTKYVYELDEWYAEIAKYNENVTAVNVSGQFDTENNMQTNTRPVNTRNAKTETYQSNGVHPAYEGYLQIADVVYRDLTHKLQM